MKIRAVVTLVVTAVAVAILMAIPAAAAPPPSMKVTACLNVSTDQLVVTTSWKNEAPADTIAKLTINYDFFLGASATPDSTVPQSYIGATPTNFVVGSFNHFIGGTGPVPWDDYGSVRATLASDPPFNPDSDTVVKPKQGWHTCK